MLTLLNKNPFTARKNLLLFHLSEYKNSVYYVLIEETAISLFVFTFCRSRQAITGWRIH